MEFLWSSPTVEFDIDFGFDPSGAINAVNDFNRNLLGNVITGPWGEGEESEDNLNGVGIELEPIEVDAVNFYCKEQAEKHHTDAFDQVNGKNPEPVVRRGAVFAIAIRFKRPYKSEQDKLALHLQYGEKSNSIGASINLEVTKKADFDREESRWDVHVGRETENDVVLLVQIPTLAKVGVWKLWILSSILHSSDLSRKPPLRVYECQQKIYILFNPWCKGDPVYMDNEEWLKEYVLNSTGKLYIGTWKQPSSRPWDFGQFDTVVLPTCMFILEKSRLDFKSRGDPIKVVRALSAMINSNDDDDGVVTGKWNAPYTNGTDPTKWTGSVEILNQYVRNRGKPVRYGQCWVFSGIFTTMCRALGIPCRSITNFRSAHDENNSVTIDKFIDPSGRHIRSDEGIWNFHVWNDCWMSRNDLPSGYGGWQAVDGTPQERSEGIFQTGPASVKAIRRGEVSHMYDCPFIFAEVNADCCTWGKDNASETGWKLQSIDDKAVGRLIVTKKVGYVDDFGTDDMEDITSEYKSEEGLNEERMTVMNAIRRGSGMENIYDMPLPGKGDVEFELLDIDKVMIGKPIGMTVKVQNKSSENRRVTAVLCCSSVYYNGVHAKEVKKETGSFVLKPHQSEQLVINLDFDDYYDKLVDFSLMNIYALATVHETHQTWSAEDDFRVEKPPLVLEVGNSLKKNQPFNLRMSFKNPLQRPLHECELSIEADGMTRRKIPLKDVRPGGQVFHKERLIPKKSGTVRIITVFNSVQLIDIFGSKTVVVED